MFTIRKESGYLINIDSTLASFKQTGTIIVRIAYSVYFSHVPIKHPFTNILVHRSLLNLSESSFWPLAVLYDFRPLDVFSRNTMTPKLTKEF